MSEQSIPAAQLSEEQRALHVGIVLFLCDMLFPAVHFARARAPVPA